MKKLLLLLSLMLATSLMATAQRKDTRCYEMRIYYCEPGKLPDLINRFRNHTTKLFEKHGMTNVGYWVPLHNDDNALYYVLSYPSKAAREESWATFMKDPAWLDVWKKSEENGKIIARIESIFMEATDFSPKIKPSKKGDRVFELRTYTMHEGKLPNILARFRNHTTKLFKKHGMTNVAYWTTVEATGKQPVLIYLLAHKSEEAGRASFDRFRQDPKWVKVRDESELDGKIVEKLESVYMAPTDFSRIK